MTKVDVISGFLGAGKTTLIRKLLKEAMQNEKVVLIENEFGEIAVDGGFLKDAGVEITEMSQGCICCSLVGDFGVALKEVIDKYHPDRIIIEPSGVGKLSDVMAAVKRVADECELTLNSATTVADASKCRIYLKNFGEFYENQVANAGAIVLSRTQNVNETKLEDTMALLREKNAQARILTTPWDDLNGARIMEVMEDAQDLTLELMELAHKQAEEDEEEHEHHHHHHYDENGVCTCGHHHDDDDDDEDEHEHHHHHHHDDDEDEHEHHHHHDDDDDEDEHEHHHHHHDDDDDEDEHEHHHHHHDDEDEDEHEHHHHHHHDDDDEDEDEHEHHHHHHYDENGVCSCGHHHHHHDADEVFESYGKETVRKFDKDKLEGILKTLAADSDEYGIILRAKGMVALTDGTWAYFDLVPGEYEIRQGEADFTGRYCVIGSKLHEHELKELFEA